MDPGRTRETSSGSWWAWTGPTRRCPPSSGPPASPRIGANIEAVTTWQWPTGIGPVIPFPEGYDPAGDARTMLESLVQPVADAHPSVAVRNRIVEGHPAEALVEASRHADLLVVGSRGHGAFSGMLLGSVSQHCASHAASPVVIYRDRPDPT